SRAFVNAVLVIVPVRAAKSALGAFLAQDVELLRSQFLAPFFIGFHNFVAHLCVNSLFNCRFIISSSDQRRKRRDDCCCQTDFHGKIYRRFSTASRICSSVMSFETNAEPMRGVSTKRTLP